MKKLPGESTIATTWPSLRRLLLAIAAVLLALNFLAGYLLSRFTPNQGYWLVRSKWKLLQDRGSRDGWLILGDSTCNQGIDPALFGGIVQADAVNLCTIAGASVLNDVWMLERSIALHGAPRAVLVMHSYDVWHRRISGAVLAQMEHPWRETASGKALKLGARQRAVYFASRYAPIVTDNQSLAKMLMKPWSAFSPEFALTDRGFMLTSPSKTTVLKDAVLHRKYLSGAEFRLAPENALALAELARLSKQHGFFLVLVQSPIYEEVAREPAFVAYNARVLAAVKSALAEAPNVSVLEDVMTFPATEMDAVDHVAGEAARNLTRTVSERVRVLHAAHATLSPREIVRSVGWRVGVAVAAVPA